MKKALTAASRGAGPSRLFDTAWRLEHGPEKRRSGFKAFPRPKTFKSRSALSTGKGTIRRSGGAAGAERSLGGRRHCGVCSALRLQQPGSQSGERATNPPLSASVFRTLADPEPSSPRVFREAARDVHCFVPGRRVVAAGAQPVTRAVTGRVAGPGKSLPLSPCCAPAPSDGPGRRAGGKSASSKPFILGGVGSPPNWDPQRLQGSRRKSAFFLSLRSSSSTGNIPAAPRRLLAGDSDTVSTEWRRAGGGGWRRPCLDPSAGVRQGFGFAWAASAALFLHLSCRWRLCPQLAFV